MRVLLNLQFEEGDPPGQVQLHFADGSDVTLSHEQAQAQLGLEAFEAELTPAAPSSPPPLKESEDDQPD